MPKESPQNLTIQKLCRENDKDRRDLQDLNNKFGIFIQQLKGLENKNYRLAGDIDSLKQYWGVSSINIKEKYDRDLIALRKRLDNTSQDTVLAQVETIRAEHIKSLLVQQIEFINKFITASQNQLLICKQQLEGRGAELDTLRAQIGDKYQDIEQRKNEMKRQLMLLQALTKEFDEKFMARVATEVQLEICKKDLIFRQAVYEEELSELSDITISRYDTDQFYRTELSRAVSNIRRDFEVLARAQHQHWIDYYKAKNDQVQREIYEYKRKKQEADRQLNAAATDMKSLRLKLEENQNFYTTLKLENTNLSDRLQTVTSELNTIRLRNQQKLTGFDKEIDNLQTQCNEYELATSKIYESNTTLQFEINTYRRLLEGAAKVSHKTAHDVTLVFLNTSTANFSKTDLKTSSVLRWNDSFTVASNKTLLPITYNGPRGWGDVSFTAIYYKLDARIIIEAKISDLFNFNNYGRYQLTLFYPNTKTIISTFTIQLEPKDEICMPKQFIIRDSIDNAMRKATIQLLLNGQIVFTGISDSQGIVTLPRTLLSECYDIQINTNSPQYKFARLQRIVFPHRGAESVTYYLYREVQNTEDQSQRTWHEHPIGHDSRGYTQNERQVRFLDNLKQSTSVNYVSVTSPKADRDPKITKVSATINFSAYG